MSNRQAGWPIRKPKLSSVLWPESLIPFGAHSGLSRGSSGYGLLNLRDFPLRWALGPLSRRLHPTLIQLPLLYIGFHRMSTFSENSSI
jgi:hypothetical protein